MDKEGRTVDFHLTAHRNLAAALQLLRKATGHNGVPSLSNLDKSGANQAGVNAFNAATYGDSQRNGSRQCKYLNNLVEQDHRLIKKRTRAMLGLKTFNSARVVLVGVEFVDMIRKGQFGPSGLGTPKTAAEQFYQLAA